MILFILKTLRNHLDPYGIEAALAERKRLRLNGWVRRKRAGG